MVVLLGPPRRQKPMTGWAKEKNLHDISKTTNLFCPQGHFVSHHRGKKKKRNPPVAQTKDSCNPWNNSQAALWSIRMQYWGMVLHFWWSTRRRNFPLPRRSLSARQSQFVFENRQKRKRKDTDLRFCFTATYEWQNLFAPEDFVRKHHAAIAFKGIMYLFGLFSSFRLPFSLPISFSHHRKQQNTKTQVELSTKSLPTISLHTIPFQTKCTKSSPMNSKIQHTSPQALDTATQSAHSTTICMSLVVTPWTIKSVNTATVFIPSILVWSSSYLFLSIPFLALLLCLILSVLS